MGDALESPYEFLGTHWHALDAKGRVVLPSPFRRQLQDGEVVMTLGQEKCLTVHPRAEWDIIRANLRALRTTDRRERTFVRMLTSHASTQTLDRQGRVTLPLELRAYAGIELDSEVAVVGADNRIELWNGDRWSAYKAEGMEDLANNETAFDIGIF